MAAASSAVAPLSLEWAEAIAAASEPFESIFTGETTVAFAIGKTKKAVLRLVDGRITGPAGSEVEPDLTIPVTGKQLTALIDGSESMALSFMRGDVKPVGSTGALLPVVALFEDADFRARFAQAVGVETAQ